MKFNPPKLILGFSGERKLEKLATIEVQQTHPDLDSNCPLTITVKTSRLDCEIVARRDYSEKTNRPAYHKRPAYNETPVLPHKVTIKADCLDFTLLHEIESQTKQVEKFVELLTERYESLLYGEFASSLVTRAIVERPYSAAFYITTSVALNPIRPNESGTLKKVLQSKELKDLVSNLVINESLIALSEEG